MSDPNVMFQYYRPDPKNITPGEWRLGPTWDASEFRVFQSTNASFDAGTIAIVRKWGASKEEVSADGRAIACVPDMIEALRTVMDCISCGVQLSDADKLVVRNVYHKLKDEPMEKGDE